MSEAIWIKNGRIIDPANGRDEVADLYIADGRICEAPAGKESEVANVVDASGKIVAPGFIDLRAHLRELGGGGRETIASGTRAAAAGGFTTVVCMPDVSPAADNPGTIRYLQDAIEKDACIDVLLTGSITLDRKGEQLAPIGSLKQSGVVAVTDCPASTGNNEIFRRSLEYAAMFDLPILDLPRDPFLASNAVVHEGAQALRLGLRGWPRAAEELFVYRAVSLAMLTKAHVHLQSLSSAGSVEILQRAKERGVPVTADVTPHHLALTDSTLADYNTNLKTNPPLREESDRQALLAGLLDGTIDCIATAHEPYLEHEKDMEFDLAPFGVIGLETALSVSLESIVKSGAGSVSDMVAALTHRPASVLGLNKGTLSSGAIADIVIFDQQKEWIVTPENLESLSSNSPWLGKNMTGRVTHVISAGQHIRDSSLA
ncbi:MAG: dihydroorotase [Opitutales bacterium]|nr:dihydroorotase [Opitutales bacterium]